MKKIILITLTLAFGLTPVSFVNANSAKDMMDKYTARQKVRQHTGYNGRDYWINRRFNRDEDCKLNVGHTYVDERRGSREVNVYTYTGDINVRCN